jgi:hypothetical protein
MSDKLRRARSTNERLASVLFSAKAKMSAPAQKKRSMPLLRITPRTSSSEFADSMAWLKSRKKRIS